MNKLFIKNRKAEKICVLVEEAEPSLGLAVIMPGLGGHKEQKHLEVLAKNLLEHNFTVLRFDPTNSLGESEGDVSDATVTNYYEDLEDVIAWAGVQGWYREPFVLVGHSLGGISVALYAEKYPKKVKGLAPIATVISGKLSAETERHKRDEETWRKTGWLVKKDRAGNMLGKIKWSHMEDRLKYDLLPEVDKLTMPVLLMVGENDQSTPPEHQQILFNKLPGPKEMHIIKGAPHTFRDEQHLEEMRSVFENWLEK